MSTPDYGQNAPAEFDWVAARAAWSTKTAFETLRTVVEADVAAMQPHTADTLKFLPQSPEVFAVSRYEESGAFRLGVGAVRFALRGDSIVAVVLDGNGKAVGAEVELSPVIQRDGSRRFDGGTHLAGLHHPWQVSRALLEQLFFRSR